MIIGHSMGGYIAQTLAACYPAAVAALVLIGTSAGGPRAVPVPAATTDVWQAAADLPPEEYARRVAVPTLVIHGTADRIVPVENGRVLAEVIPETRYREFPSAGHVIHLERPRVVADEIAAFVTSLTPIHP